MSRLSVRLGVAEAHHVPGVGQEEVLSHVRRQEVEENPPVIELDFLHAIPLFFGLAHREDTAMSSPHLFTAQGQQKTSQCICSHLSTGFLKVLGSITLQD